MVGARAVRLLSPLHRATFISFEALTFTYRLDNTVHPYGVSSKANKGNAE